MKTYHGRCRCGNIEIEFQTDIQPAALQIRNCQCGFCTSHQAATATDHDGFVRIHISDKSKVSHYRFSSLKTAGYLVCKGCGAYAGAVLEFEGRKYSTTNLRLFPEFADFIKNAVPVDYGNQSREEMLKRRLAKWTPTTVSIRGQAATG